MNKQSKKDRLGEDVYVICPECQNDTFREVLRINKDGTRFLRSECTKCGSVSVGEFKFDPDDPDLLEEDSNLG